MIMLCYTDPNNRTKATIAVSNVGVRLRRPC
jgi:hypothetical protein